MVSRHRMKRKAGARKPARLAKSGKYVIVGKKWHDDVNGNTYHSVSIVDAKTNKEIYHSPVTYGYDEAWKQTAYEWLVKKGLAKEEDRWNHELNRKRFIFVDSGYGLKRDL